MARRARGVKPRGPLSTMAGNEDAIVRLLPVDATEPCTPTRRSGMHREDKSFQTGLSEQGVEALKRQLVDLVLSLIHI